jgi:hypothetical protein
MHNTRGSKKITELDSATTLYDKDLMVVVTGYQGHLGGIADNAKSPLSGIRRHIVKINEIVNTRSGVKSWYDSGNNVLYISENTKEGNLIYITFDPSFINPSPFTEQGRSLNPSTISITGLNAIMGNNVEIQFGLDTPAASIYGKVGQPYHSGIISTTGLNARFENLVIRDYETSWPYSGVIYNTGLNARAGNHIEIQFTPGSSADNAYPNIVGNKYSSGIVSTTGLNVSTGNLLSFFYENQWPYKAIIDTTGTHILAGQNTAFHVVQTYPYKYKLFTVDRIRKSSLDFTITNSGTSLPLDQIVFQNSRYNITVVDTGLKMTYSGYYESKPNEYINLLSTLKYRVDLSLLNSPTTPTAGPPQKETYSPPIRIAQNNINTYVNIQKSGEILRALEQINNNPSEHVVYSPGFLDNTSSRNASVDFYYGPGVGALSGIEVTSQGFNYTSQPLVIIDPPAFGTTATAIATVVANKIVNIRLTHPGKGYSSAPSVTIQGGNGSSASATAHLASDASTRMELLHKWYSGIIPNPPALEYYCYPTRPYITATDSGNPYVRDKPFAPFGAIDYNGESFFNSMASAYSNSDAVGVSGYIYGNKTGRIGKDGWIKPLISGTVNATVSGNLFWNLGFDSYANNSGVLYVNNSIIAHLTPTYNTNSGVLSVGPNDSIVLIYYKEVNTSEKNIISAHSGYIKLNNTTNPIAINDRVLITGVYKHTDSSLISDYEQPYIWKVTQSSDNHIFIQKTDDTEDNNTELSTTMISGNGGTVWKYEDYNNLGDDRIDITGLYINSVPFVCCHQFGGIVLTWQETQCNEVNPCTYNLSSENRTKTLYPCVSELEPIASNTSQYRTYIVPSSCIFEQATSGGISATNVYGSHIRFYNTGTLDSTEPKTLFLEANRANEHIYSHGTALQDNSQYIGYSAYSPIVSEYYTKLLLNSSNETTSNTIAPEYTLTNGLYNRYYKIDIQNNGYNTWTFNSCTCSNTLNDFSIYIKSTGNAMGSQSIVLGNRHFQTQDMETE